MSDQPVESAALTDEQISPDSAQPLADVNEASDPDIRNTTVGQDDVESPAEELNDAD